MNLMLKVRNYKKREERGEIVTDVKQRLHGRSIEQRGSLPGADEEEGAASSKISIRRWHQGIFRSSSLCYKETG